MTHTSAPKSRNWIIPWFRFAAKQGHDLVVDYLIKKDANVNDFECQRWTALTFAVDTNQGHVVRRLLEAGADPDIATLDGPLPIDLAEMKYY